MRQKGFGVIFILVSSLVILIMVGGIFYYQKKVPSHKTAAVNQTTLQKSENLASWLTYINKKYSYSIKYPDNVSLEGNESSNYVEFDKQITLVVTQHDPNKCMGDCPSIDRPANVQIGQLNFKVSNGSQGAIGGITPQSFKQYVVINNGYFYILTVYELKQRIFIEHSPRPVPQNEISLAEKMLATLTFTNNPTVSKTISSGQKISKDIIDQGNNHLITLTLLTDTGKKVIYSESLGKSEDTIIPENNLSSDGSYFYVILSGPDEIDPLAFNSKGQRLSGNKDYIDVGKLFYDQTGLVVGGNIKWVAGDKLQFSSIGGNFQSGPIYIFDVTNKSFIKQ